MALVTTRRCRISGVLARSAKKQPDTGRHLGTNESVLGDVEPMQHEPPEQEVTQNWMPIFIIGLKVFLRGNLV